MVTEHVSPMTTFRHELQAHHQQWWCFLLLGVALILIGSFCIADPLIGSIASVLFLGFLLLAGGITQVVSAFWAGRWSGMLLHVLIGALYGVVRGFRGGAVSADVHGARSYRGIWLFRMARLEQQQ